MSLCLCGLLSLPAAESEVRPEPDDVAVGLEARIETERLGHAVKSFRCTEGIGPEVVVEPFHLGENIRQCIFRACPGDPVRSRRFIAAVKRRKKIDIAGKPNRCLMVPTCCLNRERRTAISMFINRRISGLCLSNPGFSSAPQTLRGCAKPRISGVSSSLIRS
jgi:hypothetical protein